MEFVGWDVGESGFGPGGWGVFEPVGWVVAGVTSGTAGHENDVECDSD